MIIGTSVKANSAEFMDDFYERQGEEMQERKREAMAEKAKNYFDDKGNYINVENLSLAEIFNRGREEGYKKGYIDGSLVMKEESVTDMANGLYNKIMGGGV